MIPVPSLHTSRWLLAEATKISLALAGLLLLRLTGPTSVIAFVALAATAFRGPAFVIYALFASWLLTMANPAIFPEIPLGSGVRYGLLFVCAAATLVHRSRARRIPASPFTLFFILLTVLIAAHSFLFSQFLTLSLFKLASFGLAVLTLLSCWRLLAPAKRRQVADNLYLALALLVIASSPLFVTSYGFFRNGHGFQGLLNHPQAFGVMCGFVTVWTTVRLIRLEKAIPLLILIFAVAAFSLIFSEARTAILASLLAIGLAIPLFAFLAKERFADHGGRLNRNFSALVVIVVFISALFVSLLDVATSFSAMLSKNAVGVSDVSDAFVKSRGQLIEKMLVNIHYHFWTGIGFGTPSDPFNFTVERDPVFALPVSAPIEKGVGPIAIIEEQGALLGAIFISWLAFAVRNAWKAGIAAFAVFLYALFANIGEYTFFSMGGMGLLAMILMTYGMAPLERSRP